MRIVSLLPSGTEILCALGLEGQLVGISHSCDFPPGIAGLPRVTSTGIPPDATSVEIDRIVRERHQAGLGLYELDLPLLAALRPDLMVTQGLCDVCAVPDRLARSAACALPGNPRVISQAPVRLSDLFANILELGDHAQVPHAALRLVTALRCRIAAVRRVTETLASRPRVTLLEWVDPLYACGHWTPELVHLAGGVEGHGRPGARSRRLDWEEVRAWQPEVLIAASCGLDAERTREDFARLARSPGYSELPCVRTGRVFLVDGGPYFSRPGPRLVDSLELLAHLLHPGHFPAREPSVVRLTVASRA